MASLNTVTINMLIEVLSSDEAEEPLLLNKLREGGKHAGIAMGQHRQAARRILARGL